MRLTILPVGREHIFLFTDSKRTSVASKLAGIFPSNYSQLINQPNPNHFSSDQAPSHKPKKGRLQEKQNKNMNKKNLIILLAVSLLIVLAGVGIFLSKGNFQMQTASQEQALVEELDTSDWQAQQNKRFGFALKVPGDWMSFQEEYPAQGGGNFAFGEGDCRSLADLVASCDKYVKVEVYENVGDNPMAMAWQTKDYEYLGNFSDSVFSDKFPQSATFRAFSWGNAWNVYQFIQNGTGYKLAVKYPEQGHDQSLEKAIVKNFELASAGN